MAYYRIERTKLNFQPGSVSFYYNIQYDLAMITVIIVNRTVISDKQTTMKLVLQILS